MPPPIHQHQPRRGFLGGLGPGQKAALFVGGPLTLLIFCCGGLTVISALAGEPQPTEISTVGQPELPASPDSAPVADPPPGPSAVPTPAPTPSPQQEIRTVTETEPVDFTERTVKDPNLAKGKRTVRTKGVPGVKTLTYEVTLVDGAETDRRLVGEKVTKKPVTQVVAVGTKAAPKCHPSYTGACVPFASDVDCAGGSGDGPAYVRGPVKVVGSDVYDLDRDGDGVACEN